MRGVNSPEANSPLPPEGLVEVPSVAQDDDARAWERRFSDISARVGRLRARGAVLPELEGRLAAAPALAAAGDHAAALRLLDELAVLSNALVSVFGPESPIRDPLHAIVDDRIDAWAKVELDRTIDQRVGVRQDELLASARLQERIDDLARERAEELLGSFVERMRPLVESIVRQALTSRDAFNKTFDAHLALLHARLKAELVRKNEPSQDEEAPDRG